jgi:predicted transcriptional regulator
MNDEIQRIISGKIDVKYGATIRTVAHHLARSPQTGTMAQTDKHFKREETQRLKSVINTLNLWIRNVKYDWGNY